MAKASRFFRRPSVIGLSFAGAFATSMALLALLLGFLTGWSFGDNYMALLIALFALFMLLRLRNLIFVKPKAGPVLLEAGAYPERNWYIVGIVAYLVFGLLSLDWNQNFLSSLKSQACTLGYRRLFCYASLNKIAGSSGRVVALHGFVTAA